ncbi:CopG family transcriptional regulator [Brevundimonas sp.]|uniref:CopG family transcriptional regulator n=1 Tax=Brevundimonas sp. TaxID=1871086 RepID=UPI002EDA3433
MSEPPREFQEESAVFDDMDQAELDQIMADMDAGKSVANEAVTRWLRSLSTENPLPRPKCGE